MFCPPGAAVGVHPIGEKKRGRLGSSDKGKLMKYSSKNITRITGGLIIAGLLAAVRAGAADTSISSKASDFVKEASQGNQAEISMAQLAEQKSQSSDVKNLAEMIQQDHQQAQEKLQTIAQAHGITLDQTPSWSERRAQSKLEKLNGGDFDQQYTKDMLEDHVSDIKKFQKASQQIQESDVKDYAQNCLPVLQKHLQNAETAAKAVGVDQSTITSITKKLPEAVGGTGENQESGNGMGQHQPN
jgi:putative membrane protein